MNQWFSSPRPRADARVRLFCFSYAGGSASVFHRWPQQLPETLEVHAACLPGRAFRLREPAIKRMGPLLDELEAAMRPLLDRPAALFGHSMGALVAYELARRLGGKVQHLFVSARRAPHLPSRIADLHALDPDAFVEALRTFYGTPEVLLADPELQTLVLPALRADLELLETYAPPPIAPLAVPITAFGGDRDAGVTPDELEAWRPHTADAFEVELLAGDHFFVHAAYADLAQAIARRLPGGGG